MVYRFMFKCSRKKYSKAKVKKNVYPFNKIWEKINSQYFLNKLKEIKFWNVDHVFEKDNYISIFLVS